MSGFDFLQKLEVPAERESVVISRFWHAPEITVTINKDKITVMASVDDFISAVLAELEDPAMMWEKKRDEGKSAWLWIRNLYPKSVALDHQQLQENIRAACVRALEKIKDATAQVM